MTKRPIRHHFVPQFYLKKFANKRDKNYFLFCYNKQNGGVKEINIKKLGMEKNFYKINESSTLEALLYKLEGDYNLILEKLNDKKSLSVLKDSEKEKLSEFIALQWIRTKEKRMENQELINSTLNLITKSLSKDSTDYKVSIKKESLRNFHMSTMLELIPDLSKIMKNEMKWKLSVNKTTEPFWTSDNPCAIYNELKPDKFKGNLGLKCKGFQLHIPLSSNLLLTLFNPDLKLSDLVNSKFMDKEGIKNIEKLKKSFDFNMIDLFPDKEVVVPERIIFENNLQVISSTQFIYSNKNNFAIANKYLKEYPHYKDKDRKRIVTNHD